MPHLMKKEQLQALSDDDLLRAARTGDEKAFTELVNRYGSMVHGFAFKLCRDAHKADESYQDTFINVYRKLDQFDGKSKFSTWLYAIVANNCLMSHRKRKLDAEMESLDSPSMEKDEHGANFVRSWDASPIDTLMNTELRKKLDGAIQKLPPDYHVVFVLRDVEHQTAEETAKILRLSVPAVKSRLRRARVFLREQLNQYMVQ
jgi:RNA polymerase sigma-70 factor (ECF subfamily)